MPKALKVRGKIGKSGALRLYNQTYIHIYSIPCLCFLIKYINIKTDLTKERSLASLSHKHFTHCLKVLSSYAAT